MHCNISGRHSCREVGALPGEKDALLTPSPCPPRQVTCRLSKGGTWLVFPKQILPVASCDYDCPFVVGRVMVGSGSGRVGPGRGGGKVALQHFGSSLLSGSLWPCRHLIQSPVFWAPLT